MVNSENKEKIILLGNPNVGKSVIFGLLTGKYVIVSNYPGTTVEVTEGVASFDDNKLIIDTPGTNSLVPQSEDERISRDIILKEKILNLIQVADAKNLRRALFISIQLAEANVPFILDLNMNDEALSRGISIDWHKLSDILGIEVINTIATQREGIKELTKSVNKRKFSPVSIQYDEGIEDSLKQIIPLLPEANISKKSIALMLLSGDGSLKEYLEKHIGKENLKRIEDICSTLNSKYTKPLSYIINQERFKKADEILDNVMTQEVIKDKTFSSFLGRLSMHPVWGVPVLLLVIYLTYKIVGEFGAKTCVDFFEKIIFGEYINPLMTKIFSFIPSVFLQELFVGEYGVITMAFKYAIAIVLPIVGFFFLIFGILEDTGYLPRLAMMVNRIFKIMGLNGKAVLPMILGLGCGTMAVITARILPTRKERIIVTLLLALGVPCSAQLGIIFGATAAISGKATLIWVGTIISVIFVIGFLSSVLIKGENADFIMEIPPMRIPELSNIMIKTLARIQWYLKEAVPLFVLGSFIIFILSKINLINLIENIAAPLVVNLLQLPKEMALAFVMGFLRRDYAAALIVKTGNLSSIQMLVAVTTITLFVPCIANFFTMIKETGLKAALLITSFVFTFAFIFGGLFNFILRFVGVEL